PAAGHGFFPLAENFVPRFLIFTLPQVSSSPLTKIFVAVKPEVFFPSSMMPPTGVPGCGHPKIVPVMFQSTRIPSVPNGLVTTSMVPLEPDPVFVQPPPQWPGSVDVSSFVARPTPATTITPI